ncbi:HAD-IIIC family phosphatase [Xylanibacter oryzae]|uniref:HAD-IIIC family phosphatase n=1 Tax=Xylanibacter oryzae TaxID=185293 RepID=UPI0004B5DD95|nr:HAD-IIIC family phosphatase [Xylanibacter oryzae]
MLTFQQLKKKLKQNNSELPIIKLAIVGDTSTQFLATAIKGMGIDREFNIEMFEAEYNQVELQFMDHNSQLYQFNADYIIVFQSTHKLNEKYSLLQNTELVNLAEERLSFVRYICSNTDSKIIYYNYPEIDDSVFGSYANKVTSSFTYQVRKLNYELMRLSQEVHNLFICDLCAIQNKFGRNIMFDSTIYISTEMILSLDILPYVASRTMDIVSAAQGKIKKCLILDLDNTLWGGIIGDDGMEGIQLGHGLGIGKVFTEFQMWVKKLKDRGIIICVCSKNDEDIAKKPFEKHPDMILNLDDISVFIANWETKVDNIIRIQKILNISFDSMVFIDDNPFERNMVKENIIGITVPNLPEDPAEYLEYIYSLNLFETTSYSTADKNRTKQYQLQAERDIYSKSFDNEKDFLISLNMVSKIEGFNKFNIPRIAQLSQRSNQFNLRTVRYAETDIEDLAMEKDTICISFTLKDKFGDNGLVSVVIMKKLNDDTLFIDTWFMSCRVLNRGMENFTLNTIVSIAEGKGYKKIVGEYLSTTKNRMVKELYTNLGFSIYQSNRYILDISKYVKRDCYINIENNI